MMPVRGLVHRRSQRRPLGVQVGVPDPCPRALPSVACPKVAKGIGESVKEMLAADRAAQKDAIMKSLRAVDIPRIDVGKLATTRVKPIEFPKPMRPIADVRLEQLVNAVNQLVDVAKQHNEALFALDEAMEARHTVSESRADERARDTRNLMVWGLCLSFIASVAAILAIYQWIL
jgi:hypothetical protein